MEDKVKEGFKGFCKKWKIDITNYQTADFTLNAIGQAYESGYQLAKENLTKHDSSSKKDCSHINTPIRITKEDKVICKECGQEIRSPS